MESKELSLFGAANWYVGDHTVKFGVDHQDNDLMNFYGRNLNGVYTFNNLAAFVAGFRRASAGQAPAALLGHCAACAPRLARVLARAHARELAALAAPTAREARARRRRAAAAAGRPTLDALVDAAANAAVAAACERAVLGHPTVASLLWASARFDVLLRPGDAGQRLRSLLGRAFPASAGAGWAAVSEGMAAGAGAAGGE